MADPPPVAAGQTRIGPFRLNPSSPPLPSPRSPLFAGASINLISCRLSPTAAHRAIYDQLNFQPHTVKREAASGTGLLLLDASQLKINTAGVGLESRDGAGSFCWVINKGYFLGFFLGERRIVINLG